MPPFIYVNCQCGREVRAKTAQAGSTVRCWNCGADVSIPRPGGGRLAWACLDAARDALRGPTVLPVAVGSLLVVGALLVPAVGLYLAFGLLALGAYWYQGAIADAGASSHVFSPITGLEESTNDVARSAFATLARAFWALLAAAALVAPFVIRNGGCSLIGEDRDAGSFPGMLAALAGWAAAPIVLACVNARLRRGPVPAGKAAKSLVRHPFATLLALALIPVGLLAVELFVACLAIEQGVLSLFLGDLFPQPLYEASASGSWLIFNYDGLIHRTTFLRSLNADLSIYLTALRRGHTFCADLAFSLVPNWKKYRMDPSFYQLSEELYLAIRCVLAWLALTVLGVLLSIQARCLGVVAAVDAALLSGDRTAGSRYEEAMPHSAANASVAVAVPVPIPVPVQAAVPMIAVAGVALVPSAFGAGPASPFGSFEFAKALIGPPGAPKILIIDDERAFANAIAKILVGRGFTVTTAGDAAEGWLLAHSFRPDLIVLDLLLPDRPGLDLCRDLRASAETRNMAIVVATYKSGAEDEILGLTQGADDYIAKPYVVEVLIARIEKQLRNRRT